MVGPTAASVSRGSVPKRTAIFQGDAYNVCYSAAPAGVYHGDSFMYRINSQTGVQSAKVRQRSTSGISVMGVPFGRLFAFLPDSPGCAASGSIRQSRVPARKTLSSSGRRPMPSKRDNSD